VVAVRLACTEIGSGPAVVILHGLFGSARNWQSIARRLSTTHRVLAVDLRNHGASPWDRSMTYPDMAADVAAFVEERSLGAPAVVGHSMGGKVAMVLALGRPALVDRLVVVDIAPVEYRHDRFAALVQALARFDPGRLARRGEADTALAAAIPDAPTRQFLLQNLVERDGRLAWRMNLAAIESSLPAIAGFPETAAVFRGPTLFVHGERSDYVRPQHRETIRRLFPAAELAEIAGAGHWVHAERPDAFAAAVAAFLGR
jgi:pimeloyl-ACP methyl ester carboxylesterase